MGKSYFKLIFLLSIGGAVLALIYGQIEKRITSSLPQKQVLNKYDISNSFVLYIRNLKYKEQYKEYIQNKVLKKSKYDVNIPIDNFLQKGDVIYIRKYLEDSALIEFYSPEYHRKLWGFTTGYVFRGFIRD